MRYTFLICCLLLIGCSTGKEFSDSAPIDQNSFHEYRSEDYSIKYPRILKYRFDRFDGSVSISTMSGSTAYASQKDFYLSFEEPHDLCSPLVTGISEDSTLHQINGIGSWGKINFYDVYWTGDFPQGFLDLCRPILSSGAAYALCAERNGETALVCISQAKDNPELAKQIFETFRWHE